MVNLTVATSQQVVSGSLRRIVAQQRKKELTVWGGLGLEDSGRQVLRT